MFLYSSLVLDLPFILVALLLDTATRLQAWPFLSTLRCCCALIPFNLAHYLDTEHLHMMPHGLSPAELELHSFHSPLPHSLSSLHSIHCLSLSQTCHIYIQAQPWQMPGNCGPLFPLSVLLHAGQLWPVFSCALTTPFRPTHYAFVTTKGHPSAAARITTLIHPPPPFLLLGAFSSLGTWPRFYFHLSSLTLMQTIHQW